MIIIGVDPGLNITGYGVITSVGQSLRLVEAGVIRPKSKQAFETRLRDLFLGMQDVLEGLRPNHMAIEEVWVGDRDPSSALVIGHARGVLCLAAALAGIPVTNIAHATVKRSVTGSGASSKAQVNAMVVRMLELKTAPEPADVSDALAVAIAHANLISRPAHLAALR